MTNRMRKQSSSHPKTFIVVIGALLSGATKAVASWLLGRFAP
ncbi:hypothetical protein [Streptomyces sp. NPDC057325]